MFAAVIALAIVTTLYGLIWYNLPHKRGNKGPAMPRAINAYDTMNMQSDLSRRSFMKAAAGATLLAGVSPETLMAETKEGVPQRALGRSGEKVSAIGLGGYHIGKQADESESITIIRKAIDGGITFMD